MYITYFGWVIWRQLNKYYCRALAINTPKDTPSSLTAVWICGMYYPVIHHETTKCVIILQSLQNDVLSYRSTWAVFWLWKVSTADAFLQFTLLAVLFDKLWVSSSYISTPTQILVQQWFHLIKLWSLQFSNITVNYLITDTPLKWTHRHLAKMDTC